MMGKSQAPKHRRRRIKSWKKVLFALAVCVIFFGAFEIILWAAGVKSVLEREDPFRGFSGLVSVFERDGEIYRTARFEGPKTFNRQAFQVRKPSNGLRLFCLGGSSAYGFPWGAEESFTAVLGELLAAAHPDRQVEAINVAGISYAMHRLRIVAREIVRYAPDVVMVYSGHNEFIEPAFFNALKQRQRTLNRVELALARLRIYSAARDLLATPNFREDSAASRFDMVVRRNEGGAVLYTQEQKRPIVESFRTGLIDLMRMVGQSGAKVVLATVPCNLRQWRPEKSLVGKELDQAQREAWASALALGQRHLGVGDADSAAMELNRALHIAPDHAETHYLLAQAYEQLGQWDDARRAYQDACDADAAPMRRVSRINQVIAQVADEQDALLVDVEKVFETHSEHGLIGFELIEDYVHPTREGHQLIAWHLWKAMEEEGWFGQPAVANRELFDQVIADRSGPAPQNATWFFNQGVMLDTQGHIAEAKERYRQALAIGPHSMAMLNLAGLLTKSGDFDEATMLLHRLFEIDPSLLNGRILYANILTQQGQLDEAIAQCRQVIAKVPEAVGAYVQLGATLAAKGMAGQAEVEFARALAIDPNHLDAMIGMASVLEMSGNQTAVIDQYRKIISAHPGSGYAHHNLGIHLLAAGDREEAVHLLKLAVALDADSAKSLLALGKLSMQSGASADALDYLRQALEIAPDDAKVHSQLGRVLGMQNQLDEAMDHLNRAIVLQPDFAAAHYDLAVAYSVTGQLEAAIQSCRQAAKLAPNWPAPRAHAAWILATNPRPEIRNGKQAVRLAQQATELTDHRSPGILDVLAAAQAETGQFDLAVMTAQSAIDLADAGGTKVLADQIRKRQDGYRRGVAYRETKGAQ